MTVFTFKNALFVISGPLHVRIHNLKNAMLVAKAFNAKFKVIWVKDESFEYELDDVYQTICFVDNVASSIDIVKDTKYYYNPNVSIDTFLMSCVANGMEDHFKEKDFQHLDWIVFDNFRNQKTRMLPEVILNEQSYVSNIKTIESELLNSIHVDGYVNLFRSIQEEQNMLCIFIEENDSMEHCTKIIDKMTDQLFVVFDWSVSQTKRDEMQQAIRAKYESKCMFVVHNTHHKIIEYMCLLYCPIVLSISGRNEYLTNAVSEEAVIYSVHEKIMYNASTTHLQKLMK